MTEDQNVDEESEIGDELDSGGGGLKKIIIIAIIIIVILGVLFGLFMAGIINFGSDDSSEGGADDKLAQSVEGAEKGEIVFYDVPEILVNLNSSGKADAFLKIKVSLELNSVSALDSVVKLMPRVMDNFQIYLRELRIDEVRGSEGTYRLKEELLLRVNAAVYPIKVSDILFKEILVH